MHDFEFDSLPESDSIYYVIQRSATLVWLECETILYNEMKLSQFYTPKMTRIETW